MVLTRAQNKHLAAGEPTHTAPTRRKRRRGPGVTIDDLPDELLLQIIQDATEPDDYATAHALCLVNRRFYRITAPSLWEEYPFEAKRQHVHHSFIQTLISEKSLANWVKSIDCSQSELTSAPFREFSGIARTVDELKLPLPEEWTRELKDGKREAFLSLIFCLTPNLDQINLYSDDRGGGFNDPSAVQKCLQPILYAALGIPFGAVHNFAYLGPSPSPFLRSVLVAYRHCSACRA